MTTERSTPADTLAVRAMLPVDLDRGVLDIERESYPLPWSRRLIEGELRRTDGICLVAEVRTTIVGYILVALQVDVWHILNVTVHPIHRGRGIGSALVTAAMRIGDRREHAGYTLEVRITNQRAISLYRRLGFDTHGIRRGYYSDNGEDAMIMWRLPEGRV